jgi:hypothetical protein
MEDIKLYGTIEQRTNPNAFLVIRVKYAGNTIYTLNTTANNAIASGSQFELSVITTARETGASGKLRIGGWLKAIGETDKAGAGTVTIDTTTAQNLTITAQWNEANTANILKLEQGRALSIDNNN